MDEDEQPPENINCPKCGQLIAKNNGSPGVMWLLRDHIENLCKD